MGRHGSQGRFRPVHFLAFTWGFSAFLPVGMMYLNLLLMAVALAFAPALRERVYAVLREPVLLPILLMVVWTLVAALAGDWVEATPTRLFHVIRVALLLFMGLLLTTPEAWSAITGFLVAALTAAAVVAAHHVWGLPPWVIWASLLESRNNFSSGNMISMATAAGVFAHLGLSGRLSRRNTSLALGAAAVLAVTVAFHAVSRNAQLLLLVVVLAATALRFRSLRSALAASAVVIVLVAAIWHLSPTTQTRFAELHDNLRNATTGENYATSGGVRWRMYQEAFQGMVEHPLLGTGVGSWLPHWRSVWNSFNLPLAPEAHAHFSSINNPHNDFLLAGMETGVAGLLILAWLLIVFIRQGWRARSPGGGVSVMFGVALFATALVNAPFRDAALGMTLLWLLAVSRSAQGGAAHA
jgi:O-antigen ligase